MSNKKRTVIIIGCVCLLVLVILTLILLPKDKPSYEDYNDEWYSSVNEELPPPTVVLSEDMLYTSNDADYMLEKAIAGLSHVSQSDLDDFGISSLSITLDDISYTADPDKVIIMFVGKDDRPVYVFLQFNGEQLADYEIFFADFEGDEGGD